MTGIISTIGFVRLTSKSTGERTGIIDICRDEEGNVHMRVNRKGNEVVMHFSPSVALTVADLLRRAGGAQVE